MGCCLFVIGIFCCVGLVCGKLLELYEKKVVELVVVVLEMFVEEVTVKFVVVIDDLKLEFVKLVVEVLEELVLVVVVVNEY